MDHVLTPHFFFRDGVKRSTSVIPATSLNSSLRSPTTTVQRVYRKTTSRLPPLVTSQGVVIYQKGAVLHRYEKKRSYMKIICAGLLLLPLLSS